MDKETAVGQLHAKAMKWGQLDEKRLSRQSERWDRPPTLPATNTSRNIAIVQPSVRNAREAVMNRPRALRWGGRRPAMRCAHRLFLASFLVLFSTCMLADQVLVRHAEGLLRGFLVLRDMDDKILAAGEISQIASGNRVTGNLSLRFKDGSVHEETTVFSQRRAFQLITYHLMQKGKSFKHSTDLNLNASTGQVTVISTDDEGKEKTYSQQMKLPSDVANGMFTTLLKDIDPKTVETTVSMVAATPKPRLVRLKMMREEIEDSFSLAGLQHKAIHYRIKIDIGGISGIVAPVVGKQPPDIHVWIVGGKAPGFLKLEGPLYEGGPVWKIELASPIWSKE